MAPTRKGVVFSMAHHAVWVSEPSTEPLTAFPPYADGMNVIVDMSLPSSQFELGRILELEGEAGITLETMVPLGERSVPFFRVQAERNGFESNVRSHPTVNDIQVVNTHNGETLYALDWDISGDTFFEGIVQSEANLLEARGIAGTWEFELRFPSHDALSTFHDFCDENDIPITVQHIYNPTKPEAGPWFGLTTPQRIALTRAVEAGYYTIPRQTSTHQLAAELDISDQAVTERLRRAIHNLVSSTLLVSD